MEHDVVVVATNYVLIAVISSSTRNHYASPPEGNAILAGPLSDSEENLFFLNIYIPLFLYIYIPKFVLCSEFLTLSV